MKQLLRSGLTFVLAIALITLSLTVIWQRQFIIDTVRAAQYTPSPAIAAIVDDTSMSDRGRLLFYASQPSLEDTQVFNDNCGNTEQGSMVLGCYVGGSIYIYDADNAEIAGIEEATAAHEMLHAAYDRLGAGEREQLNRWLSALAVSLEDDPDFTTRTQPYASLSEPDRLNEYHSIFCTEYAELPDELETYCGRYFDDRQRVVALYASYADVFAELQANAAALADELDTLASRINQRSKTYTAQTEALNQQIQSFNARASRSGGFATQAEFNAARAGLVAESNRLNSEYRAIQGLVATYEQKKSQYDDVAAHLSDLTNSIDSRLAPAPTVQ